MPVLINPRHERFAQELAKGKTADDAYATAGFKPNRGNASTLKANQSIIDRLAELQGKSAEVAMVTRVSLIAEAEAARVLAMSIENPSAAISAVREKGILSGERVERAEIGYAGEFAQLSDAELEAEFYEQAQELGIPVDGNATQH